MSSGTESSRSTDPANPPRITLIRETSGTETEDGKTVYIERRDGDTELINNIWDFSAYSMDLGEESLVLRERFSDYWDAYNTVARWIFSGGIRLSGGRDCFKRLVTNLQPGAGTLKAGRGIFFAPDENLHTFGTIEPPAENDQLTIAHISAPRCNNQGQATNIILLKRGAT